MELSHLVVFFVAIQLNLFLVSSASQLLDLTISRSFSKYTLSFSFQVSDFEESDFKFHCEVLMICISVRFSIGSDINKQG